MNRASAINSKQRRDRRGAVVGLLMMTLVFLTGFMALSLNVIRLQNVQSQMQTACRAAALAGAAELLDEGCLNGLPGQTDDVLAAREAARLFASRNTLDGKPIVLDRNLINKPDGDVVVGWMEPAGPVGQFLQISATEPFEANTVRVTMHLGRNVADRLTLWLGGMIGVKSFDIGARAQATIDRRICGFRPRPGVRVPLIPLVAEYSGWIAEATKSAEAGVNDEFIVDPTTGAVTSGSDGIAEMKLVCGSPTTSTTEAQTTQASETPTDDQNNQTAAASTVSSTTIACAPLWLSTTTNSPNFWQLCCREGLSIDDLRDYGNELVLYNGGRTVFTEPTISQDLAYALMDIVGQSRAWALGESGSESGTWNVVGFAAARIVAVRAVENSQNNEWEIIVQPATLVCSQAVASPLMNPNPWVAKLELTQ
jgi:hypothetical protein